MEYISTTSNPIYKSLFNLKVLKSQIRIIPNGSKSKSINSFLTQYNNAIKEAKEYRSKAPKESSTKDIFKAAHHAGMSGALFGASYTNPKSYITQSEYDAVIKELTACKKYLEKELKQLESFIYKSNDYSSLFDFELL